jgi:hypothetical protein
VVTLDSGDIISFAEGLHASLRFAAIRQAPFSPRGVGLLFRYSKYDQLEWEADDGSKRLRGSFPDLTADNARRAGLSMPTGPGASRSQRNCRRMDGSSDCGGILAWGRLPLARFVPERSRDRQSDCRDHRKQRQARCRSETSGAEHVQDAGMTNFRLVQERIAFDNDKCDSRRPKAEDDEPCPHATRC